MMRWVFVLFTLYYAASVYVGVCVCALVAPMYVSLVGMGDVPWDLVRED